MRETLEKTRSPIRIPAYSEPVKVSVIDEESLKAYETRKGHTMEPLRLPYRHGTLKRILGITLVYNDLHNGIPSLNDVITSFEIEGARTFRGIKNREVLEGRCIVKPDLVGKYVQVFGHCTLYDMEDFLEFMTDRLEILSGDQTVEWRT